MIGKVLQGRYQIVQSLGAGVFGQTYVALDISFPEKPRCVVKRLKSNCSYPSSSYSDHLRLRLLTETETLIHLGNHPQIPQLINCFEENKQFYLVQEYIPGRELSTELPINPILGNRWSEADVVSFLGDVLGIIEFVHSQGFIHCDIKPENLIRRAKDSKLVLIDFGSIQPIKSNTDTELSVYQVPLTSLGYIPPEQFIGQTKPNSDIYALGMIAIQAFTGLTPLQLQIDPETNEIKWRSKDTPVNDHIAAILSRMIRYHHQDRFQTVSEVLQVIKPIKLLQPQLERTITHEPKICPIDNVSDHQEKSYPLLAGLRFGLTINSLLIALGVYALFNTSIRHSETESLATKEWQKQIHIPLHNSQNRPLVAQQSAKKTGWSNIIGSVSPDKDNAYWQSKIDNQDQQVLHKSIQQPEVSIEVKAHTLLSKAYSKAATRDFSSALEYLRQIPPESYAGTIVEKKLIEYNQKRQLRAAYFLYKANNKASIGDLASAVKLLQKISPDTAIYPHAQIKLNEYSQNLNLHHKNPEVSMFSSKEDLRMKNIPVSFHPGYYLNEVNVKAIGN